MSGSSVSPPPVVAPEGGALPSSTEKPVSSSQDAKMRACVRQERFKSFTLPPQGSVTPQKYLTHVVKCQAPRLLTQPWLMALSGGWH